MTSPDLAIAGPEACPYLGLADDPRTHFAFATPGHRCHVKAKQIPIDLGHQSSYCLSTRYPACVRFRSPRAPVATATMASAAADAGPSRDGDAGWGRALRHIVVALALLALVAAIGVGAFGKSPADGVAPGGVASPSVSPSAAATPAPTPAPSPSPTVPPAPTDTAAPAPIVHVVAPGESLSSIAELYGVTEKAIQDANKIDNPSLIVVGQKLVIPAPP